MEPISRKYPLDLKNSVWLKVNIRDCTVSMVLYRVISSSKYAINMNCNELEWFVGSPLPPNNTMGGLTSEVEVSPTDKDIFTVRLQFQNTLISISKESWEKMKIIVGEVLKDFDIVTPHISNKGKDVVIFDRLVLKQILLACAKLHYQSFVNSLCKLCELLYPKNNDHIVNEKYYVHCCYSHNPECKRMNKYLLYEYAEDALAEFSETDIKMVLLSNDLGSFGLSKSQIIGNDLEAMVQLIVEDKCFYPVSEALIQEHADYQYKFMQ